MLDPSFRVQRQCALVTGATGFIGSHLVEHLRAAGWEVHMLVRPSAAQSGNFPKGVQCHSYGGKMVDVVEAFERAKPNVVFHLASLFLVQHTPAQVASMIEANLLLGTHLLQGMSDTGVKLLVNTGTSWQHFHTDTYRPVNLYAATKQAFEDILAYYADADGIRAITLLLFDSYGPGDTRKKILRILIDCLETNEELQLSPGHQILDLAHVDDLCDAFLYAAKLLSNSAHPAFASYAVSGGQRMSLREIVAALEEAAGRPLRIAWGARPYREREVMRLWDGPPMPGWQPQVSLAQGLKELLRERSL